MWNIRKPIMNTKRSKNEEEKERSIDFERLHKINLDIVAWIEVPGTNIDYPVVQGKIMKNICIILFGKIIISLDASS